jgi:pyruvate/2-oxoglutarate/acetoin dehydrogenase E1 component
MAAQHSQSLEAWFAHTPGLVVAAASTPADSKGLLKSAIRNDNPVIFFEKRLTYGLKGPVPTGEHLVPLGRAAVARQGTDVTIVTYGSGVFLSQQAARRAARQGVEAEVIDLRTLRPLDIETIAASVRRTHALVVVNEAPVTGSLAAEICAKVVETCFSDLDAPPVRVGAAESPVPCALPLERAALPQVADVEEAILRLRLPSGRVGGRMSAAST